MKCSGPHIVYTALLRLSSCVSELLLWSGRGSSCVGVRNLALIWWRDRVRQGLSSKFVVLTVDDFFLRISFHSCDASKKTSLSLSQTFIYIPKGVDNLSTSCMIQETFLLRKAESSRHISEPICRVPWLVELSTMILVGDDASGKCNFEFWKSQPSFRVRADHEPLWHVTLWYSCDKSPLSNVSLWYKLFFCDA